MGINVLSAFDGMSCGQIALERAGIAVDNYFASEIDPYAIKITQKNYPKTVQLGSITEWRKWNLPKIHAVIGGSPCQGFSIAGGRAEFNDPRSRLFLNFADILRHYKPEVLLLENVRMSQQSEDIISCMLGEIYPECIKQGQLFKQGRLEPILINSALVSAQNRERLYWTNIPNVCQPEDKGILLKDIVESGPVVRGVSDKLVKFIINKKGVPSEDLNRKSKCFTAGARSGGSHSDMDLIPVIQGAALRSQVTKDGIKFFLNIREDEKNNCVVGSFPNKLNGCVQIGEADIKGKDSIKRVYSTEAKGPTLTAICGGHQEPKISQDNITWRKLTPLECERLQTVSDGYTEGVSNSRRYHALGNGWTVDVIAHIFSFLPKEWKKDII